ncbi:TPA: sporulation protein [Bacillus cereus]|nr:sporulation protein [Bacillus cereus]
MIKLKKTLTSILVVVLLIVGYAVNKLDLKSGNKSAAGEVKEVVQISSDKFPETAAHIKDAIKNGKTDICTIDRKGAADRRKQSLANVPTKKGYDRDEYPMAMCKEGGTGADIRYIDPSDNRGAGSYIGSKASDLQDGTKFKIVVK